MFTAKNRSTLLVLLAVSLWVPREAHAMAVKNWISNLFTFHQSESPPDYIDSQWCPDCQPGMREPGVNAAFLSAQEIGGRLNKIQCKELAVGEERGVVTSHSESPSGVENKYILKRTADGYEAKLNIAFKNIFPDNPPAVENQMRRKMESCVAKANGSLLGPSGEKLSIKLQNSTSKGKSAPLVTIAIDKPGAANTSQGYAADISCSVILHELLHLMGLVDEYDHHLTPNSSELAGYVTKDGKISRHAAAPTGSDCRAKGPDDSIMAQPNAAWANVFDSYIEYACQCENDGNMRACLNSVAAASPEALASDKNAYCPHLTKPLDAAWLSDTTSPAEAAARNLKGLSFIRYAHRVPPKNPSGSLLKPAHFFAITQPGCAVNVPYYLCGLEAYKSGKSAGKCAKSLPRSCSNGSTDWINFPGK